MEVNVYNIQGEKTQTVDLPEAVFEAPVNIDLMHQAYVRQLANARLGTHSTKTRGEVRGGGRKPWRQKGTGRARQGSIRSPQWVGGGRVHTPRPRDYSQKMPRKMRRAALRSALSVKAANNEILVVDQFNLDAPKTSQMAATLQALAGNATVLMLLPDTTGAYELVAKSARNLAQAKTLHANYLNIRDLLGHDKILLPLEALDAITAYLG